MKKLPTSIHGAGEGAEEGADKDANNEARTFQRCQKAAQRKEKQEWAIEEPKLDNARRLRGFYFFDPGDVEFEETIRNAWKKLNVPMEAAMPCKIRKSECKETCTGPDTRKSKYACVVEANE